MTALSFRGVAFGWQERGGETTPRFAEHDFPQKPGRWHEDMAAGPRVFTFQGYVLGPGAELARAKLRLLARACGDQRPGTLVHPVFGAIKCVCTGFRHKETIDRLGRIDLDLSFTEDNGATSPIAGTWPGKALSDAIDSARDAIGNGLDQVWNLAQMPSYVLAQATAGLADISVMVLGGLGQLGSAGNAVAGQAGLLTGIEHAAEGLSAPLVALFSSYTTGNNGRLLALTPAQADTTAAILAGLGTYSLPAQRSTTFSRAVAAQALGGLADTVRRLALTEEANVSRLRRFVSADQAIAVRDDLANRLDAEILAAADQASIDGNDVLMRVSDAMAQVRTEAVADLTDRAASLKPVSHITLPRTRSAVALAYALYGDGDATLGDRANTLSLVLDLVSRNRVRDPGLMPGGVPLEYLLP